MIIKELCGNLETLLNIGSFTDDISLNGLQVGDESCTVKKVAFAVDACKASFEKAVKIKADMLIVHHGLFWGKPLAITGAHYRRVKILINGNVALFACHLPLDAHPVLGNNAQMVKALGLTDVKPFDVGFCGRLPESLTNEQIVEKLGIRQNGHNVIIGGGRKKNKTVAIISGKAPSDVYEAIKQGIDVFITGEGSHTVYHDCIEQGINMLCLGHYETEVFGVKALASYVKKEYGLETCFIDVPTLL